MERNNHHDDGRTNQWATPGRGPQGVDKAPGEETSQSNENQVADTQKGKNKVDGDPSQPSDQPADTE